MSRRRVLVCVVLVVGGPAFVFVLLSFIAVCAGERVAGVVGEGGCQRSGGDFIRRVLALRHFWCGRQAT